MDAQIIVTLLASVSAFLGVSALGLSNSGVRNTSRRNVAWFDTTPSAPPMPVDTGFNRQINEKQHTTNVVQDPSKLKSSKSSSTDVVSTSNAGSNTKTVSTSNASSSTDEVSTLNKGSSTVVETTSAPVANNGNVLQSKGQNVANNGNVQQSKGQNVAKNGNVQQSKVQNVANNGNVQQSKGQNAALNVANNGNVLQSKGQNAAPNVAKNGNVQQSKGQNAAPNMAKNGNVQQSKGQNAAPNVANNGNVQQSKGQNAAPNGNVQQSKGQNTALNVAKNGIVQTNISKRATQTSTENPTKVNSLGLVDMKWLSKKPEEENTNNDFTISTRANNQIQNSDGVTAEIVLGKQTAKLKKLLIAQLREKVNSNVDRLRNLPYVLEPKKNSRTNETMSEAQNSITMKNATTHVDVDANAKRIKSQLRQHVNTPNDNHSNDYNRVMSLAKKQTHDAKEEQSKTTPKVMKNATTHVDVNANAKRIKSQLRQHVNTHIDKHRNDYQKV